MDCCPGTGWAARRRIPLPSFLLIPSHRPKYLGPNDGHADLARLKNYHLGISPVHAPDAIRPHQHLYKAAVECFPFLRYRIFPLLRPTLHPHRDTFHTHPIYLEGSIVALEERGPSEDGGIFNRPVSYEQAHWISPLRGGGDVGLGVEEEPP